MATVSLFRDTNMAAVTSCEKLMLYNVWFSLAHKQKNIRTRRMAYLTQFLIPALLNLMLNKMACAILLLICSHEVWVKVTYDWSMALC